VENGFVIPLPYGTRVDWLQNVRAAGRATISVQGYRYEVAEPDVVDAAAALRTLTPRRRRYLSANRHHALSEGQALPGERLTRAGSSQMA